MGGSFVEKVREHWWPEYSWTKFFWFNAGYFMLMIASVVLYDSLHGTWLILPIARLIERFGNGFWHLAWAIRFREYSPGPVSSILMWMNFYFIVRYRDAEQAIPPVIWVWALVIAGLATTVLTLYIPLVKGRQKPKGSRMFRRAALGGRERL
jgi:hypothetical protein